MSIYGVLGETTSYPKTYSPNVLYPIARSIGRDEIVKDTNYRGEYVGVDIWQAFELSWLNAQGISQMAMARISVPAISLNIVESKSFKLYFNSLNFSQFADWQTVQQTIAKDLTACAGAEVLVMLYPLDTQALHICRPLGECIDGVLDDDGHTVALTDDIDSVLLQGMAMGDDVAEWVFYSNLLRSNCPVTNQPDWGTLQISIRTKTVLDFGKILAYVLSFRQHNGFHEQCVERIFADCMQYFAPISLTVQANYTRRGGIDINPVRVFNAAVPVVGRLIRQ
ncbi:MAG: NADPH-dependent 7-cyano-7-deazaguanine reductase QueF [Moraxella sp.]|nr:NADPH-dependent 7-cyano-7-deazaguanine reductase QueF [Moraxella sp.]